MAFSAEKFIDYAADIYEHRSAPRYQAAIPATLKTFEGEARTTITDLSVGGFACKAQMNIRPGARCTVDLPLIGQRDVEIIRNEGDLLRCAFHRELEDSSLKSLLSLF